MSDNIVDFTQRLQQSKAASNLAIPVEAYQLGTQALLMDPHFQLDYMSQIAAGEYAAGEMGAPKIHRLLKVMQYLYEGVLLPFDLRSTMVVRHQPDLKQSIAFSVYNWAMPLGRMSARAKEQRFSYQIHVAAIELEDMARLEPCGIYPPEWMGFDIPEDDVMTARFPKHIIKKMNQMVVINSGRGMITEDGAYMIALPDSGIHALVVTLELERPIRLLPEDQRQPLK